MMETTESLKPFDLTDIEDVRIIIKAKGKHWAIVPKGDNEDAKINRIGIGLLALETHFVVDKPFEDFKNSDMAKRFDNQEEDELLRKAHGISDDASAAEILERTTVLYDGSLESVEKIMNLLERTEGIARTNGYLVVDGVMVAVGERVAAIKPLERKSNFDPQRDIFFRVFNAYTEK